MRVDPVTTDEPCEVCDFVRSSLMVSGDGLGILDKEWIGPRGCGRLMVCQDCLPKVIDLETSSDELPSWLQL